MRQHCRQKRRIRVAGGRKYRGCDLSLKLLGGLGLETRQGRRRNQILEALEVPWQMMAAKGKHEAGSATQLLVPNLLQVPSKAACAYAAA